MTLSEVWTAVELLPPDGKLQLANRILRELVKPSESTVLDPNVEYPVWSPNASYEAAATIAQMLADQGPFMSSSPTAVGGGHQGGSGGGGVIGAAAETLH